MARDTHLKHGSKVDLQIEAGRIVLTPVRQVRRYALKSLLSKITSANVPSDDSWGAPTGREVW